MPGNNDNQNNNDNQSQNNNDQSQNQNQVQNNTPDFQSMVANAVKEALKTQNNNQNQNDNQQNNNDNQSQNNDDKNDPFNYIDDKNKSKEDIESKINKGIEARNYINKFDSYVDDNKELLGEDVADALKIHAGKSFTTEDQKFQELRTLTVKKFFEKEENTSLLHSNDKKDIEAFLQKNSLSQIQSVGSVIGAFDRAVETKVKAKAEAELRKDGGNNGENSNARFTDRIKKPDFNNK